MKFYISLYSSEKALIRNLVRLQGNDRRSNFGCNVSKLCEINNTFNPRFWKRNCVKYMTVADCDLWRVPILKELLYIRENSTNISLPGFSFGDLLNIRVMYYYVE